MGSETERHHGLSEENHPKVVSTGKFITQNMMEMVTMAHSHAAYGHKYFLLR